MYGRQGQRHLKHLLTRQLQHIRFSASEAGSPIKIYTCQMALIRLGHLSNGAYTIGQTTSN